MTNVLAGSLAFVLGLAWVTTVGCDGGEAEARRALDSSGYSRVTIGDYAWIGCGKGDDGYRHHFTADNPVGKRVKGYVCCGWGKGCTVRF